jgi:lipopolysaccharide/colanic/teichoic acid biosynthesis glycosyltransferase
MSTVTASAGTSTLTLTAPRACSRPGIAERLTAALALGPCLPAISIAGVVIRMLSGRSPLVAHKRVGLNGEQFWMLKLRTMWDGAASGEGPRLIEFLDAPPVPASKRGRDPRVSSRFAAICRKFSIDELPQLIHIIAGRMSFIGPRPLTPEELETHYGETAREILQVSPGITGLWQVLGRNRLTYPQRRRLDLFFVRKRSFALSAWILLRTPARVLSGRNSS